MIKLKDILREIGEANIAPFNWTKTSGDSPQQFKEKMGMEVFEDGYDTIITYKFTTDKGTQYGVDLQIEEDKEWEEGIECEIDFSIKGGEGRYLPMDSTNMHEQYAVMSTITDILVTWVNEWDKEFYISKIKIDPIKDDEDDYSDRTQNKRGKLYYAFMKKQLHRLNKEYYINVFDNHFEISPKS
tara:strand:- start:1235 stop:1789 length:555 start_codon:yes stop_codon:yes gene_type:complete